jgi:hypothetical protein
VTRSLGLKASMGDPPELLIHQRVELVHDLTIAAAEPDQEVSYRLITGRARVSSFHMADQPENSATREMSGFGGVLRVWEHPLSSRAGPDACRAVSRGRESTEEELCWNAPVIRSPITG